MGVLPLLFLVTGAHGVLVRCPALGQTPPDVAARIVAKASAAIGAAPQPVARLKSEGLLPTHRLAVQASRARQDFDKVRALAYAWRLTGRGEYLGSARVILLAWAGTFRTSANPIDEARLPVLAEGYALVRADLAVADRLAVDAWWRGILAGHLAKLRGRQQANNWQSHRIHIATAIAFALEDLGALNELSRHHRTQVLRNIRSDGSTFDFRQRDAIRYAAYTLQPLVETQLLLAEAVPLPAFQMREVLTRLEAGLDWLLPYADGRRTHVEFAARKMPTDRKRAEAGITGYSRLLDPPGARPLFLLATSLDPSYRPVAATLSAQAPDPLVACRGQPAER